MAGLPDVNSGTSRWGADQQVLDAFGHGSMLTRPTTMAVAVLGLVLIVTRLASSKNTTPRAVKEDGAMTVPTVPYWIPVLGHLPNMALSPDSFIKSLRTLHPGGIFTLNFGGSRHNIMYTPGLATALLNQKSSNADIEEISNRLMKTIFGFPAAEQKTYDEALGEMMGCYKHLLTEPSLGLMVAQTADNIKKNINNLVTFAPSLVDQMLWERASNVKVTTNSKGGEVVEASLLSLIRNFCAHTANASIMGTNFLANFPAFFDDLWVLDRGFLYLAAGLPRWLPIPSLTKAHIARHRILQMCGAFYTAFEKHLNGEDPGADWQDLDDVGSLVKARAAIYRQYNLSIRGRAALEHALLWAANANSNPLIFWMMNHIYADPTLLAMLREEIAPYVKAVQPKQDFPIPEPPRLEDFDVEGLCNKCPLLKSCYVECLRLDTAPWSLKVVKQDFVLQAREKGAQGWLLRKGDYAHAAHDLHNTDPDCFEDPMVWKPDRHVRYEGDEKKAAVDMGTIRPYGGGSGMCKGRAFAFKEVMMFAAAIIALWDIEPAGGGGWKMPRHRKASGVYSTDDTTRVWIKRRKLPEVS